MANKLSKKAVKFIGFAGIGLLLLGGGVLVGNPLIAELSGQTAELKAATANTETLKTKIATLTKLKTDNPAVDKINVALLTQFPELANVPALLDSISTSADTAGISADNITNVGFTIPKLESATPSASGTPAAPAAKADAPAISSSAAPSAGGATGSSLASMDVSITVKGDTGQFQVFLKQLTSMARVFTVKTFNIAVAASTSSGPGGSLTISGTTYLYKHIQAPVGGGASVGNNSGTATDPNNPTTTTPNNSNNPTIPGGSNNPTAPGNPSKQNSPGSSNNPANPTPTRP